MAKILSDHASVAVKTRNLTPPTKKLDCPVAFHIKKLYRFPTFKLKRIPSGVDL